MTEGRAMDLRDGERVRWIEGGGDYATTKGSVWRDKKTKRMMAWILCEVSQAEFHVPVSELVALEVEAQCELLDAAEETLRMLKCATHEIVWGRLAAAIAAVKETSA